MTALKQLLTALHDVGQWLLHVILILPIAALKALDSGIQHLLSQLEKL